MKARTTPLIIPIFLPHAGCPHQCIFCNQHAITGTDGHLPSQHQVRQIIETQLSYPRRGERRIQIAFFGGNFLGLPSKTVLAYLDLAQDYITAGKVAGIRFSTRPDTIDKSRLDLLHGYAVQTVELGVQSMDNGVLRAARRGHRAQDTIRAVEKLKAADFEIGLQIMVGLPGETRDTALPSARQTARLAPDFVRIYPTLVLENSPLAEMYRRGQYQPMDLDDCVNQVKEMLRIFTRAEISVARMGLQASEDLADASRVLAGPYHPAFGHLVHARIFFDKAVSLIRSQPGCRHVSIRVHPSSISKMRGLKNQNTLNLEKMFALESLKVIADTGVLEDSLEIKYHK
jgi:histone acetyltransferase (RNA polymerase elongator complex component)